MNDIKISDIEEELKHIRNQYSMPFFPKNYEDKHKIYKQYENITYKMLNELYGLAYENMTLKNKIKNNIKKEIK